MMPEPDTGTDCVGMNASSVTTIFPDSLPVCEGVKITAKVQVPPAATCVPLQLSLVTVKSPEGATLVTLSGTTLGLVKVTVFAALATSSGWLPKLSDVGEKVGLRMMPVPDTGIDCVGVDALSVTTISAVSFPVCEGVKITPKVQVPPAATWVPLHVSLVTVKSPEGATLVTLSATTLGFVKVTVFAALASFTGWLPKLREAGEKVGFRMMPVPERFTVCGLLDAPSVIVRVPVRAPAWLGVNTTLTTQFAPGASRTALHPSFETEKSPAEGVTLSICSEEAFGLVRVTF